jgi:3-oxoacyl-[acyl-carrier-protein] synthase-3
MNGAEVFNFSIKREPEAIAQILEFSNKSIDEVEAVVFHLANRYIISNIARRLKIPKEKTPCGTVEKYGNQSSASIPGAICDEMAQAMLQRKQQCIFSGFGVGLSWGTALTTIGDLNHCELSTFND